MQSPRREPRTLRLGTYHSKIPIIFFFSTFRLVELGDLGLKLNPHECSGPGPEVLPCWWNWPLVWEPLVDVVLSICASGPADLLALEDDFQPQNPSQCVSSCSLSLAAFWCLFSLCSSCSPSRKGSVTSMSYVCSWWLLKWRWTWWLKRQFCPSLFWLLRCCRLYDLW